MPLGLRGAGVCFCLAMVASAQSAFTACEAGGAVAAELESAVAAARSPLLDLDARLSPYLKLMERYPLDIFVNRRYMEELGGYARRPLFDQLVIPRFETLYRQHPNDPASAYLHARSIAWRDRAGALAILESLDGPWPQLALAALRPRAEKEAAGRNLEHFLTRCPASLDPEALRLVVETGSEPARRRTAERLRQQLPGRIDAPSLAAWPVLWQLEFQLEPASGHAELRKRVSADAARLRLMPGASDARLHILRQGYRLAEDAAGERWAREELMRVAPSSRAAAEAAIERWMEEHPTPRGDGAGERSAYTRLLLAAGEGWADRWPNFEPAWGPRLRAVTSLPDLPPDRLAAFGKQLLACMRRNPDFTFGFTDPPLLAVAERLANAGVELPLALQTVELALRHSEQRLQSDLAAGGGPMGEARIRGNTVIERWSGRRIRIAVHLRSRRTGAAAAELEEYRKEVAAADAADRLTLWRGLSGLVAAGLEAGRKDVARAAVTRMAALVAGDPRSAEPREEIQRSLREADYWRSKATLAESEGRRLDAAVYYRRAAEATPGDYNPRGRSSMMDEARRVWSALGGASEAFEAWNGGSAAQTTRWVSSSIPMPAFSLQDAEGNPIRLADLAGKTLFISVWATWCGPCQAELKQVQRIHERLKQRGDLRILSFNIDENPGIVKQYMQQHSFSFPAVLAREFVESRMNVESIPRNWIVDGNGILRLERQGGADESFVQDVLAALEKVAVKQP